MSPLFIFISAWTSWFATKLETRPAHETQEPTQLPSTCARSVAYSNEAQLDEIKDWLDANDPELSELVWVARGTGLRLGELLALRPEDVRFHEVCLNVRSTIVDSHGTVVRKALRQARSVSLVTMGPLGWAYWVERGDPGGGSGRRWGRPVRKPRWHVAEPRFGSSQVAQGTVSDGAEAGVQLPLDPERVPCCRVT